MSTNIPKMEKILKPKRLVLDPSSIGVETEWKHWKKVFNNYLTQTQAKTDETKLKILFNCISSNIFSYISRCEKFDAAISVLDAQFLMRGLNVSRISRASYGGRMSVAHTGHSNEGDHALILKLKSTEENLNNKMVEVAQLKKKLTEHANVIKQEQNALRMMETKKIAIAHKVTIFEGQIEDLKEEKKLMVNLVEELRAELALKESAITKKELALRKIQTQKDSLQEDVQRWQDANKESRKSVSLLQENLKDARNSLKEREFDIEKLTLDNKHLITERDICKQQLKKTKDDNERLNKKFNAFAEITLHGKSSNIRENRRYQTFEA
ncbi:cilia- and flagella-associated protein 58 isoform X1 [Nilaparvata lugens]|uniref:cilia- and flagella-associated protein 58 isoform X1 n=1 Tax=Nilaparvata lugens TaxID=108931 RepID=UPI00193E98B9|nr:cilia- and flagella-associated protein 58 isoform X1 [Nilaparvata lugens]